MLTNYWLDGGLVVYLLIGLVFATRYDRGLAREYDSTGRKKPAHWLRVLFVLILSCVWPLITLLERQEKADAKRKAEKEAELAKKKEFCEQRIAEWKRKNRPKVFFNTMAGVIAMVRADDYYRGCKATSDAVVNGFWEHGLKVLMPIRRTFVFVHKSGMDRVPESFRSGWFSDVDELRLLMDAERREDIFVPFVSENIISTDQQREEIWEVGFGWDTEDDRLDQARSHLLHQEIPAEITETD